MKTARYLSRETKWDFFDFYLGPPRTPFWNLCQKVFCRVVRAALYISSGSICWKTVLWTFSVFKRKNFSFFVGKVSTGMWKLQSTCPEKRIKVFFGFFRPPGRPLSTSLDKLSRMFLELHPTRVQEHLGWKDFFFERRETVTFLALWAEWDFELLAEKLR